MGWDGQEEPVPLRTRLAHLKISAVERGEGIGCGERFYVYSFQRKKDAPRDEESAGGHVDAPKVGASLRAFVNRAGGRNEGIYPDWWDALKPDVD